MEHGPRTSVHWPERPLSLRVSRLFGPLLALSSALCEIEARDEDVTHAFFDWQAGVRHLPHAQGARVRVAVRSEIINEADP